MNRLRLVLGIMLICGFGLGCEKGNMTVGRNPAGGPSEKPTAECKAADTGVHQILFGAKDFVRTHWMLLGDNTCVVRVLLSGHGNIIPLMRKLKERAGFYTHVMVEKTPVSLWWDEPAFRFPLAKDEKGKPISNAPTDAECLTGADYLAETFPRAHFDVKMIDKRGRENLRCYIEGVFPDESGLENFMSWKNPRSLKGELLHMNFPRKNGSVSTVWIRALMAAAPK